MRDGTSPQKEEKKGRNAVRTKVWIEKERSRQNRRVEKDHLGKKSNCFNPQGEEETNGSGKKGKGPGASTWRLLRIVLGKKTTRRNLGEDRNRKLVNALSKKGWLGNQRSK